MTLAQEDKIYAKKSNLNVFNFMRDLVKTFVLIGILLIVSKNKASAYNDLSAVPIGYEEPHFVAAGELIEYHARFQNTGIFTVQTVILEGLVDTSIYSLSSFQVLDASHSYSLLLQDNGYFNIRFDDIFLPNSTNDEPNSHGFALYTVALKSALDHGIVASQSIGILFDDNEPILTNEVFHTVYDCLLLEEPTIVEPLCEWGGLLSADQQYVESYSWTLEEEEIGTSAEVALWLPPGDYTLHLEMTNPICTRSIEYPLSIQPYPTILGVSDTTICEGDVYIANAFCEDCEISWSNGIVNGEQVDLIMGWPGNFLTAIAVNSAGCESAIEFYVNVNYLPNPWIISYPNPNNEIGFQFETLNPEDYTYQWFYNGEPVFGETSHIIVLTSFQSGEYSLQVTDQFGCSGVSSPLGWVNVEELNDQLKIKAFPSPATENLTIEIPSTLIGEVVTIYDVMGKEVHRSKLISTSTILDVTSFSGGTYVLRVADLNVKVFK